MGEQQKGAGQPTRKADQDRDGAHHHAPPDQRRAAPLWPLPPAGPRSWLSPAPRLLPSVRATTRRTMTMMVTLPPPPAASPTSAATTGKSPDRAHAARCPPCVPYSICFFCSAQVELSIF